MLDPRSIALQGLVAPFPLSPIAVAVQGLVAEVQRSAKHIHQDTDQGIAGKRPPGRDFAAENLRRMFEQRGVAAAATVKYNITRLHQDDAVVADMLVALVTEGFFDET